MASTHLISIVVLIINPYIHLCVANNEMSELGLCVFHVLYAENVFRYSPLVSHLKAVRSVALAARLAPSLSLSMAENMEARCLGAGQVFSIFSLG